jgi:hypothetical protein
MGNIECGVGCEVFGNQKPPSRLVWNRGEGIREAIWREPFRVENDRTREVSQGK